MVTTAPIASSRPNSTEHSFGTSTAYSVGVEEEFQIVDPVTFELVPAVERILKQIGDSDIAQIKRELMQSVLETSTRVCSNVDEASEDLARLRTSVQNIASEAGVALISAGTTPVSRWEDQIVTDKPRYRDLVSRLQWIARRELIFGLHVHVGVDSADKCMYIFNNIREHLPALLALSANSPMWQGDATGLQSSRIKVFDAFPRSGMPQQFDGGWNEFTSLLERGAKSGAIPDHTYIWWDVRPHPGFGTIEVRICDAQSKLSDTLAITSLVQATVAWLGDRYDSGQRLGTLPPQMLIEENRWSAARYGLDGEMIDLRNDTVLSTRRVIAQLLDAVEPVAKRLGSTEYFDQLSLMLSRTGADRQLSAWSDNGRNSRAVGQLLVNETLG